MRRRGFLSSLAAGVLVAVARVLPCFESKTKVRVSNSASHSAFLRRLTLVCSICGPACEWHSHSRFYELREESFSVQEAYPA